MILKLWKNFNKRKNSTAQPFLPPDAVMDVVLKEGTSIESPVFMIEGVDLAVNYCEFNGALYFIDDIVLNNRYIYELHCSMDALGSNKSAILNSTQFVERSASMYDVNVFDNYLSTSTDIIHKAHTVTSCGLNGKGVYVIRTVGRSGLHTYILNSVLDFFTYIFNPDNYDFLSDSMLKAVFNPFQYVSSVMWLPLSTSDIWTTPRKISCGWLLSEEYVDSCQDGAFVKFEGTVNLPEPYYNDFRGKHDSITHYNIYLPAIGTIQLSAPVVRESIKYDLTVDVLTGTCTYILTYSDGTVIGSYTGCMGVNIQIGQMESVLTQMLSGVAGATVSATTGNFGAMAGELVSTALSTAQPTPSINGSVGNMSTLNRFHDIVVSMEVYATKDYPTASAGRPLYKNVQLSELSGFCKCGNASLYVGGLGNEKDIINNYLNSGFYIE